MKHIFLCGLFMVLCIPTIVLSGEFPGYEAIENSPPSPGRDAYLKVLREQKEKEVIRQKKAQEQQELFKKFEAEQADLAAQYEIEQETLQRECEKDFGQIRVGMKLERVQKCVAEFFLRGQVKTKDGVVDHYTRGDSWLYVKKGKVVAWGD